MKTFDEQILEMQQRFRWYIAGIGLHGLSWELFAGIPTSRICEIYNVEPSYFADGR